MTEQHTPGNLFSLIIPGKDKPTKIYGILHRDKPTISYGILLRKDKNMDAMNSISGWWQALIDGKEQLININSDFYKTVRHINEN